MNDRFVIFGVPQDITKEDFLEAFKDYGTEETDISYKTMEETGNERGGMCFVRVAGSSMG